MQATRNRAELVMTDTKIGIFGAQGRMGRRVTQCINELENVIECWLTDLESPLLKDRVSKSIASSINDNIGGECKMG